MDFSDYRFTAHRGLHGIGVPENSLPAFLGAVTQSFAIELDVHLTRDGKIVVFHDHSLKRMTGVDECIEDCDWSYLQTLRLMGSSCRIPGLEEVLELVDNRVPILIEAKDENFDGRLEKVLTSVLSNYNGRFLIESFNPYVLWWLKRYAPQIGRGQLAAWDLPGVSRLRCWALRHMIFNFLTNPNFIAYRVSDVTDAFFEKRCGGRIGVFAWTVHTADEYEKAYECDGIIFEDFDIRCH